VKPIEIITDELERLGFATVQELDPLKMFLLGFHVGRLPDVTDEKMLRVVVSTSIERRSTRSASPEAPSATSDEPLTPNCATASTSPTEAPRRKRAGSSKS
jgi:hypothetical protein